jgi:hypothetical protein
MLFIVYCACCSVLYFFIHRHLQSGWTYVKSVCNGVGDNVVNEDDSEDDANESSDVNQDVACKASKSGKRQSKRSVPKENNSKSMKTNNSKPLKANNSKQVKAIKITNSVKKMVASDQGWKCQRCNNSLSDTFHVMRDTSNKSQDLIAVCHDCK